MGITLPSPFISLILVFWVATYIEPAHINNVIFPIACITIWVLAPKMPIEVARDAPRIIYDN